MEKLLEVMKLIFETVHVKILPRVTLYVIHN